MAGPIKRIVLATVTAVALSAAGPSWADRDKQESRAEMHDVTAEAPYVRPDVRAYLDQLKANPRPALTPEFLAMVRNAPPEMMSNTAMGDLPVGDLGEVRDVAMPGPGGEIQLRLFDPRPAEERKPGPVVIFYHGGAFVVGNIHSHAGLSAEMARSLDLPVISVEYRLAPENPWPAAPDDAEAAARWIAEHGEAFDREFTGLVLSGDSAGANLTLVTSLALSRSPAALPVLMQLPIYPLTDHTREYPSGTLFKEGYGLDTGSVPLEDMYKPDPQSWRSSPLLADLSNQPPTLLVTASLDPLRDQGRAYAAKLIEAGVPTTYYEGKGLIHGFATYRSAIPSAQTDTRQFLALARTMLDGLEAEKPN